MAENEILEAGIKQFGGLQFEFMDRIFIALHLNEEDDTEVCFAELVYSEDGKERDLKEITEKELYDAVYVVYKKIAVEGL